MLEKTVEGASLSAPSLFLDMLGVIMGRRDGASIVKEPLLYHKVTSSSPQYLVIFSIDPSTTLGDPRLP